MNKKLVIRLCIMLAGLQGFVQSSQRRIPVTDTTTGKVTATPQINPHTGEQVCIIALPYGNKIIYVNIQTILQTQFIPHLPTNPTPSPTDTNSSIPGLSDNDSQSESYLSTPTTPRNKLLNPKGH
jgi:hypothetical protein